MKNTRVIVPEHGGQEVLQVVSEEAPEPRAGEYRVKIIAAGVSYADMLMREGVHPESVRPPFTPGWDLVGVVDKPGEGVSEFKAGQMVAALPIRGGYAGLINLPEEELVPVPDGVDPGQAVSLVLNYVTAYQMMHRTVSVAPGQRVLIHAASGGVGSALLQLGRLAGLEMYGTASPHSHDLVSSYGATPINYKAVDFVEEIRRLTGTGVDVVFDGIGRKHLLRSYQALRPGGVVVGYGLTSTLRDGEFAAGRPNRLHGLGSFVLYTVGTALIPDRKRMKVYSIQTMKRFKPAWFREDLSTLFALLSAGQIQPLVAERLPLVEARQAHHLQAQGVRGKIVLIPA